MRFYDVSDENYEYMEMKKGLFWVIGDDYDRAILTYAIECDKNGQRIGEVPVYNSKKGDSFSHRQSWAEAAIAQPNRIKNKPWDYFPRGRVEIKDGKATIYFNPILSEWNGFEASVAIEFELADFPLIMIPDYSTHYKHKQE